MASASGHAATKEASHDGGERTRQFDRQFNVVKLPVFFMPGGQGENHRLRHRKPGVAVQLLDSQGNSSVSELIFTGETRIFQGADTPCTSVFSEDGNTPTAHHEPRDQNGSRVPSMEVVLTKVS